MKLQQELRRSTSTASESSVRDGTKQKWKSLGLSDSDGSSESGDDGEREGQSDMGKGVNFYCDMISPSPSSREDIQLCHELC